MTDRLSLNIVVLNYRTPALTIDALRSLEHEVDSVPGTHVIVADNASGDGSVDCIREAIGQHGWTQWAEVLPLERNMGFAGGNNAAIRRSGPSAYVLLLNSDTVVRPGCLRHCIDVMERCPDVGALSCRLLNEDGSTQVVTRPFPTPLRQTLCALGLPWRMPRLFGWADSEYRGLDLDHTPQDVGWVGGAFLMLRGSLLESIGMLDEDFFFYGEDIEMSHRIMRAGYRRHYDPAATTTHLGGGSPSPGLLDADGKNLYRWQARYMVQRKCYGAWAAWWLRGLDWLVLAVRWTAMGLCGERYRDKRQRIGETLGLLSRPLHSNRGDAP